MATPETWRDLEGRFSEHAERGRDLNAFVHLESDLQAHFADFRSYGLWLEQNAKTRAAQVKSHRLKAKELEAFVREPRHPIGNWTLIGGPKNLKERGALLTIFTSLAERGALNAGLVAQGSSSECAVGEWLHLIRGVLPHQVSLDHAIENVWNASALMCHVLGTRAQNLVRPAPKEVLRLCLDEAGWTVDVLAAHVTLQPRSVSRHLAGGRISAANRQAYADAFSQALGRSIRANEFNA